MKLTTLEYAKLIRQARINKGWSQKDLSERAGITQSHLSKIERGETDLRVSNLIELTRLVDMEVMLVPKRVIPAVKSLVREVSDGKREMKPAYRLDEDDI